MSVSLSKSMTIFFETLKAGVDGRDVEITVRQLAKATNRSTAATSVALSALEYAGLIRYHRSASRHDPSVVTILGEPDARAPRLRIEAASARNPKTDWQPVYGIKEGEKRQ